MLRRLRIPLTLVVLTALLIALGYWNIRPESFMNNEINTPPRENNTIDFFVIHAHSVQYQADGTPKYEMTTDRLEHLKTSDITLLTRPDLLLFRGTASPWHVRSKLGEVSPQGKEVELIDAVRVERSDSKGRPSILTTSRLTVFPEKDYAQTQQAVMIEAANGVTTAKGMKAYLNDGRMRLLSNIRGQHEVR